MNKEGMEIARGFKDAAIIENLQRRRRRRFKEMR